MTGFITISAGCQKLLAHTLFKSQANIRFFFQQLKFIFACAKENPLNQLLQVRLASSKQQLFSNIKKKTSQSIKHHHRLTSIDHLKGTPFFTHFGFLLLYRKCPRVECPVTAQQGCHAELVCTRLDSHCGLTE